MSDIVEESPPLSVSSEQRGILDHLWLCHEKGPGPHQGNVRARHVILFMVCCLAISTGSVLFANQIPPSCSSLVVGFIIGILFVGVRREIYFQRHWPFFESIIDWKLVQRMRKSSEFLRDDYV